MMINSFYLNDNEFTFNKIHYERDEYNGRCYQLEDSTCLRNSCDGKLVKKRIKVKDYEYFLTSLKNIIVSEEEI